MIVRVVNRVLPFIIAGAVACGQSSPTAGDIGVASSRFVGEVAGTDARLAVVTSQHHARLYFCGGDASYATSTRWLVAPFDASGAIALGPPDAPWRIAASLFDGTIQGWIDRGDGEPVAFRGAAIAGDTLAGLYEAMAPCGKVGVIVAQPASGIDPIAQGACIPADPAGRIVQVNPLMPLAARADGSIAVMPAGAADSAFVRAASPPAD